ncbi:MAG: CocE/NonD family hydrolase [Granulosicoccus sp.]|nr:CocE/NonD family hydrolase [Granulosicoccus sp.]
MSQQVKEIEHTWISMSDGIRLSARLWLPDLPEDERVPAILEYIPYRKRDMVRLRDQRNHPYFAEKGYVSIRVDMRGSGDSEGTMPDMYAPKELDDAIQVIEWIAHQPWCNGRVGMMGTSWGGTASLQAASRRPDALKAVIAVCANNNRFDDDIHHMGGCLLTDTVEWGATLPAILASPPDAETVGSEWREIWRARLDNLCFPLEQWVKHESRDGYWRWGSVNDYPDTIECPVLMIGGWSDRYSNTVMNFLQQSKGRSWGIVGPWGHHYPDQASPGPAIGFQQEAVKWWDRWLKEEENDVDQEPQLRVWMQEYVEPQNAVETRPGRWVSEPAWPSPNVQQQHLYFSHHSLVTRRSETADISTIPWSLSAGSAAGDTGYFGRAGGLPLDQNTDDAQSLVFQTDALEEGVEILGRVIIKVNLKTDRLPATLAVRLCDVHSGGSVARVCYAIRNLALNAKGELKDVVEANEWQTVELAFPNTAYRFAKGHRIRIAFSTSYWPIIWPSPSSLQLQLDQSRCQLSLPVRQQSNEDRTVNFPAPLECDTNRAYHEVLSAPPLNRWVDYDQENGRLASRWHQPFYCIYHSNINLKFGFETEATHSIQFDDPCSALSCFKHTLYFSRGDWEVYVTSSAECQSSETHYVLEGKLEVSENGKPIFQRDWHPEIPRSCS